MKQLTWSELSREVLLSLGDVYWGPPDEERYEHSDIEDAVDYLLDGMHPEVPDSLTLVAMKPRQLTANEVDPAVFLDAILEQLDDEYGDPDGEKEDPTPAMKEAAQHLAEVIAKEYQCWLCDEVLRVTLTKQDIEKVLHESFADHQPRIQADGT